MESKMQKEKILDILRKVNDPEFPMSVVELGVVDEKSITVKNNFVEIEFTPTTPFCPEGIALGVLIKYAVEEALGKKVSVKVKRGTYLKEDMVNDLLRNEARYAEALQRIKSSGLIEICFNR